MSTIAQFSVTLCSLCFFPLHFQVGVNEAAQWWKRWWAMFKHCYYQRLTTLAQQTPHWGLALYIWTIQGQEILYMDHSHGLKIICEFEWSAWFVQECLRIDRYRYDCIETPIVWPGIGLPLYCMARSGIVIPLYCMARSGIGVGVSLYGQVCKQR